MVCTCGTRMEIAVDSTASSDGWVWQCVKSSCRRKKSIRTGSFFSGAHLSIQQALKLLYWWAMGCTEDFVMHQVGIARHTAVDYFNFCRELCMESLIYNQEAIGGPGRIVEIDEMKLGKRKFHRGRRIEGQWIFGMIERDSGPFKCVLVCVPDRSEATLRPIIESRLLPGTTIISDCWSSYSFLRNNASYIHMTVNHSVCFKDPTTGAHTNTMEGFGITCVAPCPSTAQRRRCTTDILRKSYLEKGGQSKTYS